nr:odorant receptor 17 [Achelura yunnanensis]
MLQLLNKIKAFLNKENSDYSKGDISPYDFHLTFYYILTYYKIINDEPTPYWAHFLKGFIGLVAFTNLCLGVLSTANGMTPFKLSVATEGGTYLIIVLYSIAIYFCSILNKPMYHCFLRILKQDFHFICTKGHKYRTQFFENQLRTWKLSIFAVVFTSVVTIGMIVLSVLLLLFYFVTHKTGDGSSRPLLLPLWFFDVDIRKSPFYEIAFNYSHVAELVAGLNYIFMIQTQIVWVDHIKTKTDMVTWFLRDLFENLDYPGTEEQKKLYDKEIKKRLCNIVKHHQSMYELLESYAGVYKKMLMFEQKLCGPIVCLTSYCTLLQLEAGEFNGVLLLLGVASIILTYIPCHLCTTLSNRVSSISDACKNASFWNANPKIIRPYLVLMIQRSLRPLPLQAPGFEPHSLQTFYKAMVSAYSLFNMLRQANV